MERDCRHLRTQDPRTDQGGGWHAPPRKPTHAGHSAARRGESVRGTEKGFLTEGLFQLGSQLVRTRTEPVAGEGGCRVGSGCTPGRGSPPGVQPPAKVGPGGRPGPGRQDPRGQFWTFS